MIEIDAVLASFQAKALTLDISEKKKLEWLIEQYPAIFASIIISSAIRYVTRYEEIEGKR